MSEPKARAADDDELTNQAWRLQASLGRTANKIRKLRQRAEPDQWPALERDLHRAIAGLVRAMDDPDQ